MALTGYNTGSPGVKITETNDTGNVSSQSITIGALVGNFTWGPVDTIKIITDEDTLKRTFDLPYDSNYKDWFSAWNFLCYSKDLRVVRVVPSTAKNASDVEGEAALIKSKEQFTAMYPSLIDEGKTAKIFAKYPGEYGNRIKVIIEDGETIEEGESKLSPYINQMITKDDVAVGVFVDNELKEFGVYSFKENSKTYNGESNYVISAVNNGSNYIYLIKETLITYEEMSGTRNKIDIEATLKGGITGDISDAEYIAGWNLFDDPDATDVGLLIQGAGSTNVGKHIIDNIAGNRKDCIACVSPQESDVVNILDNTQTETLSTTSTSLGYSQYRFMDGNYKYQYDHINDVYRWVPLNADMAGIFAQVDEESAPWFSPGNYSVKNVVKLAFYPTKAQRDELYKYRINPVTSFKDSGHILYGDWTGADVNDAFNFVNVRRMFNYIEKSIIGYARKILYKMNDEVTQTSFFQAVDPFLREVQGGRGISQYRVVCDSTVNTSDVVASGKFVAKIYVLPVFSVRWVELNFINTRTTASFTETII